MKQQEILFYIEFIRAAVPNAEEIFTEGNCGSFAQMLLFVFPEGRIMHYYPRHFVFEYKHFLYDITGDVSKNYDYSKLTYIEDLGDINTLMFELAPKYKK